MNTKLILILLFNLIAITNERNIWKDNIKNTIHKNPNIGLCFNLDAVIFLLEEINDSDYDSLALDSCEEKIIVFRFTYGEVTSAIISIYNKVNESKWVCKSMRIKYSSGKSFLMSYELENKDLIYLTSRDSYIDINNAPSSILFFSKLYKDEFLFTKVITIDYTNFKDLSSY